MIKDILSNPAAPSFLHPASGILDIASNLDHLDTDYGVRIASNDFTQAFFRYHGLGDQPSFDALEKLHRAGLALREALQSAEERAGRNARTVQSALLLAASRRDRHMAHAGIARTPPVMLEQLDAACDVFQASEPDLNRFVPLFSAIMSYFQALREQPQYFSDAPGRERILHELARGGLDAPLQDARLRKFRAAENAFWSQGHSAFNTLRILPDFRSTSADQDEFEDLFKSGALLRSRHRHHKPDDCRALFERHRDSLAELKKRGTPVSHLPLMDMLALRTYSINHQEINQVLRDNDREKIGALAPYIKLVVSGLNRIPAGVSGTPLRRGMRLDADALVRAGFFKGNRVTMRDFTSASAPGAPSWCRSDEHYNVQLYYAGGPARQMLDIAADEHMKQGATYGMVQTFDVVGADYREGKGSKEYPRIDVRLQWVDMSRVRADGRYKNSSFDILGARGRLTAADILGMRSGPSD
jgi:hypothetical protein